MENRKKIYLDYNLVAYYLERKPIDFCEKFDLLRKFFSFPYSPAHLEEIAVPIMMAHKAGNQLESILKLGSDKINNLSAMTGNLALAPREGSKTVLVREAPIDCLRRVITYYGRNGEVEQNEENFLQNCKNGDPSGDIANRVSSLPVSFLRETEFGQDLKLRLHFDMMCALEARKAKITDFRWPFIGRTHQLLERTLELSFNFLEEIRFKPEKVSKSRSRIHDVTHAIYATSADYLVSNDDRFISKVKAVYSYFGIKTKVISLHEFMETKHF